MSLFVDIEENDLIGSVSVGDEKLLKLSSKYLNTSFQEELLCESFINNELRRNDKDNYEYYISLINKGILINYNEIYNFWNNYKNPIEPIIKYIYDKFLKANKE